MEYPPKSRTEIESYTRNDDHFSAFLNVNRTNGRAVEMNTRTKTGMAKPQRNKKGLHFGARRVDPSLFQLKESHQEEKPSKGSLQPPSIALDNRELKSQPPVEMCQEGDDTDPPGDLSSPTAEDCWKGSRKDKHSAHGSMFVIPQSIAGIKNKKETSVNISSGQESNKNKPNSYRYRQATHETDEARKKFGSAKSISSDQFFGRTEHCHLHQMDLSRFADATAISSDQLFNRAPKEESAIDLFSVDASFEDVSDCFRAGVSKVAKKVGSAMNSFVARMSQDFGDL